MQVDGLPDEALLTRIAGGVEDRGEWLGTLSVRLLRQGDKTAWLEIVLGEGRNRHIRRLLDAFGLETLRLVRVAIGSLELGDLAKGQTRELSADEIHRLAIRRD